MFYLQKNIVSQNECSVPSHSFARQNVQLGVKSGMIRTVIDCQAGVDALKESYRQLSLSGKSDGILGEWFSKKYLNTKYLSELDKGVDEQWTKNHNGKSVNASVVEALKDGVGQPLLDLINYLDNEHKSHCLPNDLASGLANLPVDYVYNNGVPDKSKPTNKKLPTGEPLNGTESYKLILSYFTTTDISPEEIFDEGKKQLKFFYDQVGLANVILQLLQYLSNEWRISLCAWITELKGNLWGNCDGNEEWHASVLPSPKHVLLGHCP